MASSALVLVARAQEVRLPYWARDHAPIAAIALYNGTYEDDDPLGLHECWRAGSSFPGRCEGRGGGVTWLISELDARYAIGYRRFMLNLPAGHVKYTQHGIGFPSAQWHVLDTSGIETLPGSTSVRQDFATLLTPWLAAHADVQIIIYQGLRFNPAVREPWKSRLMIGSIAPDLTRAFDRRVVQENTKHWLALSPATPYRPVTYPIGFAFDNTGVESTRDALLAVLDDRTLFGNNVRLFISGEAIPHTFPGGDPIPEVHRPRAVVRPHAVSSVPRSHRELVGSHRHASRLRRAQPGMPGRPSSLGWRRHLRAWIRARP